MKVLVTGGAGFIGSHLVRALALKGLGVIVLDDLSTGRKEHLPKGAYLVEGDIRDRASVDRVFAHWQPKVVFHLAGQASVRRSITDTITDLDVNVKGAIHVFEASARSSVEKVVFASSGGAIYGDQDIYPASEEAHPKPRSPYAVGKLASEHYGAYFDFHRGFDFTALRLGNVYGPGQNPEGEAGVIAIFLGRMAEGRTLTVYGDGEQTRDFIFVGDVAQAFLSAMEGPPGTFNIGTGIETSLNTLIGLVGNAVGWKPEVRHAPAIPAEVRRNVLGVRRAQEILGWTPSTFLSEGLKLTAEHQKGMHVPEGGGGEDPKTLGPTVP
jgi:UDP-glucose 4-epimerase